MTRFVTAKSALLATLVVGVLSTTLWWFGGFPGLHWPHFRFGGWQAANTTNQQTGTVNPLGYKLVTLDGVKRVINPSLQQARIEIESPGSCAELYNSAGARIGRACSGTTGEIINGMIYSAASRSGKRITALVTICPPGSPGTKTGSCN